MAEESARERLLKRLAAEFVRLDDSGRDAHRNGWYVPEQRIAHNLDAKPEPASPE